MTRAALVAVVTPVYNGAKYIVECVESVLAQTYERFEYVVVDNRSTDGTADLVRPYAERDPRLRLVEADEFVGAIANANRALRLAPPTSDYVKVLHADDALYPECLERMVELAAAHPSVGVVGARRFDGETVTLTGIPTDVTVVAGHEAARAHLLGRPWGYFFGTPTSVLYRADLVRARDEFYNVSNPFQSDQEACLELLAESDFGFVHEVLTFTRRHEETESTYYHRVGAEAAGQLDLLVRFGRRYLTEAEYRRRLAARAAHYAASVARDPRRFRDPDARAYHARFLRRTWRALRPNELMAGLWHAATRRVRL